jgi:hypothetical protein
MARALNSGFFASSGAIGVLNSDLTLTDMAFINALPFSILNSELLQVSANVLLAAENF